MCHGSAAGYCPPRCGRAAPARLSIAAQRRAGLTTALQPDSAEVTPASRHKASVQRWAWNPPAEPETSPQDNGGLTRAAAPSSLGAAGPAPLPGQSGWLPPQRGGPAAGIDLWAPSQAPTQLLEYEQHLPAQEQAEKRDTEPLRGVSERSLGKAPAHRQTGLGTCLQMSEGALQPKQLPSTSCCGEAEHGRSQAALVTCASKMWKTPKNMAMPFCFPARCLGLKPLLHLQAQKRAEHRALPGAHNTRYTITHRTCRAHDLWHRANTTEGSRMPRAASYPQRSTCREAKPALCCYYFLFIQEEFIQSFFEQQDPGLFFSFLTGDEKTNTTSAGSIHARLRHPHRVEGR